MRYSTLAVACVCALALSVTALAASPHFKKNGSPTCQDTGTQLSCSGSLAGLGNGDVDIGLTADAQASFNCVNPGGNEAPGQNKVPFTATGSSHFDSNEIKNGSLAFTVAAPITPPTATPQEAGCPSGKWSTRLTDVEFAGVRLTISQDGTLLFDCSGSGASGTRFALSC